MRKHIPTITLFVALSALLLSALLAPSGLAQKKAPAKAPAKDKPAAQAPAAPQFMSVQVVRIHPGMGNEYQEFLRTETLPALQKAGVKMRSAWVRAVFGEANEYVAVMPIESMAQYDSPGPIVRALGEEGARAYGAKAARFIANSRTFCLQSRPDLSLEPKMNEPPKLAIGFDVSVAPGRALDYESIIKTDFLPALKKADLKGVLVSRVAFGGDTNQYVVIALYDSFAEIGKGSPLVRALGQEGANRLSQKTAGIVLRTENAVWRYVPELSLPQPAPKAENR